MSVSLSPSNLYAEKVFAEHPLSLWALDDDADYLSLIDNKFLGTSYVPSSDKRNLSNWTITNAELDESNVQYSQPVTRYNLFWDPNATSATGWSSTNVSTTTSISSSRQYAGTTSLRVVDNTGVDGIYSDYSKINIDSGTAYTFSMYIIGEIGKAVTVSWTEYTALGVPITEGMPSKTIVCTGIWQRVDISKTTGSTSTKVSVAVTNTSGSSHVFYLDAFLFEKGYDLLDYFDGSSDEASWSGTPNNSVSSVTKRSDSAILKDLPFSNLVTGKITSYMGNSTVTLVSQNTFNSNSINPDLATVAMGSYFYWALQNIQTIQFGYKYDSTEVLETFAVTPFSSRWVFLSKTFDFSSVPANKDIKFVIKISLLNPNQETTVFINGLNAGQWAEEFFGSTPGTNRTALTDASIPNIKDLSVYCDSALIAHAYGLSSTSGLYLIKNNKLLAKNTGIPLVFGAANLTSIYPNSNEHPSLLVPGYGFLNEIGKNKVYTSEFWIRINSGTVIPKRIFGPIASTDGLYVDGPFLTLKVGSQYKSHYIAEWYRPMLVHITYFENTVSLMINGEQVLMLELSDSDKNFPSQYLVDNAEVFEQDWLGFYAYDDVTQLDIDCVGIYSYKIPPAVAKRRWVFGQGVDIPENINSAYNGTTVAIDYSFANHSNNYGYPNNASWGQGILENATVEKNVLSSPNYALPTVNFNLLTEESWYTDLTNTSGGAKITLRPNSLWDGVDGYMLFEKLGVLNKTVKSMYGLFDAPITSDTTKESLLIKVEDETLNEYVAIVLNETEATSSGTNLNIEYRFKSRLSSVEEVIHSEGPVTKGNSFAVGFDIDKFASHFGKGLPKFFANKSRLKVYVAGDKTYSRTFPGNIERVGFCTPRNHLKISPMFNSITGTIGVADELYDAGSSYFGNAGNNIEDPTGSATATGVWEQAVDAGNYPVQNYDIQIDSNGNVISSVSTIILQHIASYTLLPKEYFGTKTIDIATDSYWEDYIPLKYFGKNIIDQNGDTVYGLDFVQFNLDYPRPSFYNEDGTYNTLGSAAKTYITFQYTNDTIQNYSSWFTYYEGANKNGVVIPTTNWNKTKYEVVDGSIIYMPPGVDFEELAIAVHIEFASDGILHKKIKFKNLQLASKALDHFVPNKIGTRFGVPMYSYQQHGYYFDYKQTSPYRIYKGTTPYLYLTRNSGIQPVGVFTPLYDRGISIPVNQAKASRFRMTALQAAIRFEEAEFPTVPMKIAEVDGGDRQIALYLVSTHPNNLRGKIYAVDLTTEELALGIKCYINGELVLQPEISLNEWNIIGLSVANTLNLDGQVGMIKITGPILVNNLSFYEETALQRQQSGIYRQWYSVLNSLDPLDTLDPYISEWEDWRVAGTWNNVLVIASAEEYGVSPTDIYNAYTGTNKIIVNDGIGISLGKYVYTVFKDVAITTQTITPA
jgi:hypothetical protein